MLDAGKERHESNTVSLRYVHVQKHSAKHGGILNYDDEELQLLRNLVIFRCISMTLGFPVVSFR